MNKQIEQLRLYFDTEFIHNKTNLKKLTPTEFTNIRLKIIYEKNDGAFLISDRVFIQMMNSEVFIYEN